MSLYSQRGVSAQKEDVHEATRMLDKGLYPYAFCKLFPDYLSGDDNWINTMHADGAGTKSILAYLYWKETGDISVWKGIAQDAIVMNLDDLLCTGITDNILFSSTIDRNKRLIPAEVLDRIYPAFLRSYEVVWCAYSLPGRGNGRRRRCGKDDRGERNHDRQVAKRQNNYK